MIMMKIVLVWWSWHRKVAPPQKLPTLNDDDYEDYDDNDDYDDYDDNDDYDAYDDNEDYDDYDDNDDYDDLPWQGMSRGLHCPSHSLLTSSSLLWW